jgi:hypothetical protein
MSVAARIAKKTPQGRQERDDVVRAEMQIRMKTPAEYSNQ